MGSQLNPHISCNGNARRAMEFYQEVFGGRAGDGHGPGFRLTGLAQRRQAHARPAGHPDGDTLMAWDVTEGVPYHRAPMLRFTSAATTANSAATSRSCPPAAP